MLRSVMRVPRRGSNLYCMNDLRIRLQELAGDSAVLYIVTRRDHPSAAELGRALIPMGLRVILFDEWVSRRDTVNAFKLRTFTDARSRLGVPARYSSAC